MGEAALKIDRYFSPADGEVYSTKKWEDRSAFLNDEHGNEVFRQDGVSFPTDWSQLATNVVSSKYFYGEQGTGQREYSAKQLLGRVSSKFEEWFLGQGYAQSPEEAKIMAEEIAAMTLEQRMSFNSPVWFNVGIDHHTGAPGTADQRRSYVIVDGKAEQIPVGQEYANPQTSACFIQSVDDTMEDIMDLAIREAMLFKYGSGTGTDLSTLRSSHEKISGGGDASGPMAYKVFYDDVAGIVKSGGVTRRAAKMNSLLVTHPDIEKFINAKAREQEKINALMEANRLGIIEITREEANETAAYQNSNLSVRATDEFMRAVEADAMWQTIPVHDHDRADEMPSYKAKDLWKWIAEGTWYCGDPGVQFHSTINDWHTCPNSGSINASNPCSEYMFLDDSACNLASLNLMKFRSEARDRREFNVEAFQSAVERTIVAQDSVIDGSSYPDPRIAENAFNYRPLGLGFANLGALLMSYGLPYDSDEGRAVAASITALETGTAYLTSTKLAEKLGAFNGFEENRDPMLRVIGKHRTSLRNIDRSKIPAGLEGVLDAAEEVWAQAERRGEEFGFRNSQVTVLAPTGTIAFMMDCDTTGVEPDIALVKYKLLAGGGQLKITNQTVPIALETLGYDSGQVEEIVGYISGHDDISRTPFLLEEHRETLTTTENLKDQRDFLESAGYTKPQVESILMYINGTDTIEGAPHLREEHLPVFDCAFKPAKGKRSIHYTGHVDMMAATQPFISGAISKTVNVPKDATAEEISSVYMSAWKKGLKAVAIYRDGSKVGQPLSTSDNAENGLERLVKSEDTSLRRRMPATRESLTHKAAIMGHDLYFTVGLYDDGSPGELFINMAKEGSTVGGVLDTFGTLVSIALQNGIPLRAITSKMVGQRFEPSGLVVNPDDPGKMGDGHEPIKMAKSVMDYVGRWLNERFGEEGNINHKKNGNGGEGQKTDSKGETPPAQEEEIDEEGGITGEPGGPCPGCGDTMIKKGGCLQVCPSCYQSSQTGCSE